MRGGRLAGLVISALEGGGDPATLAWLRRQFPTVQVTTPGEAVADSWLEADAFRQETFDFWVFDRSLDALAVRPFTLGLAGGGEEVWLVATEVLTRAQRLLDRRNRHSESALFERILEHHRSIHDLDKPLVRADYGHTLDVWQWMLRLDPEASFAAQVAGLYHDVERLRSEADVRVEGGVVDYQAFKDAHAHEGAAIVSEYLGAIGVDPILIRQVLSLVASHERLSDNPERRLLADADALSFFSFNSPGFIDYYGKEHAYRKVAYTLRRLSPEAAEVLSQLRLRRDVAALVAKAREEAGR